VKKYDLSKFKNLWLAGERADIDTIKWAEHILDNRPVIDNWYIRQALMNTSSQFEPGGKRRQDGRLQQRALEWEKRQTM